MKIPPLWDVSLIDEDTIIAKVFLEGERKEMVRYKEFFGCFKQSFWRGERQTWIEPRYEVGGLSLSEKLILFCILRVILKNNKRREIEIINKKYG